MEEIRPGQVCALSLEGNRANVTAEVVLLARLHSLAYVPG